MGASADRIRFAFVEEVTFGVAPTTAYQQLRLAGETLEETADFAQSVEIRDDGQAANSILQSRVVSGSINFVLSYGTYDDQFQYVLRSAVWTTADTSIAGVTDVQATSSPDTYIDGTTGAFTPFLVHSWVYVTGFTNAANNGLKKVVSVTTTTVTDDTLTVTGGLALVTEAAGQTVSLTLCAEIKNATTGKTATYERQYTDLTTTFALFVGCRHDAFRLELSAEQTITGSFDIMGKQETEETAQKGSTVTAVTTTENMSSAQDVDSILENFAVYATTAFSLSVFGNARRQPEIGSTRPSGFGDGTFRMEGSLSAYWTGQTPKTKFLANTLTQLALIIIDQAGNGYVIDMPAVRFTGAPSPAQGINQDIILAAPFVIERDTVENVMMRIARFVAQ